MPKKTYLLQEQHQELVKQRRMPLPKRGENVILTGRRGSA